MNGNHGESEVIFRLNKKRTTPSSTFDSNNDPEIDQNTNESEHTKILCIICRNGKVGAAYYNFQEKILYMYEEMIDLGPNFLATTTLYREIKPKYILTFGNVTDDYVKLLIDLVNSSGDSTVTSDGIKNVPENFFLLPLKEYSYEICKSIVTYLELASNFEDSQAIRELHIHSLINFDYRLSVQTLGALVKYLEKNWTFFGLEKDNIQYMHINQATLKDHVLMDNNTFKAIQIFSEKSHDAGLKRGTRSSAREGLSIFKLFSTECKSKIGQHCLKNLLLTPIKNFEELQERLEFVSLAQQPINKEFIESLQDNIKNLYDVNGILIKIQHSRATNRDWNTLYKTIYHSIFINEISRPYRQNSGILSQLNDTVSSNLIGLENSIRNALDFSNNTNRRRPVIKFGIDEALDAKLLMRQDISKHVTAAARFAVQDLPDFLDECAVVYLPEMGHFVAIKEWEPECDPDALKHLGFQFMFTLRNTIHYKSPLCVELDRRLGDINAEIIDHENRILRRLSGFTLKYNKDIRAPLKVLALLDSLIAMAIVAANSNYVRPQLNRDNIHEIIDCRHPLKELLLNSFKSNSFYSGGDYSRLKILTGPNGSGKSIYLKQITFAIFLAHVGSFVPAKSANVGLVHSIHSRIQATESASVRLSAFMIDITQTTHALNHAMSTSLIVMDEFGRGTTEDEGIALFVGFLKRFLDRQDCCPHILVSTHFQQIVRHLPPSGLVEYQKMEHTERDGALCFLYKVVEGVSNSFALDIAEAVGLDEDIIARARNIFECLKNNAAILPALPNIQRNLHFFSTNNLNIPPPDEDRES